MSNGMTLIVMLTKKRILLIVGILVALLVVLHLHHDAPHHRGDGPLLPHAAPMRRGRRLVEPGDQHEGSDEEHRKMTVEAPTSWATTARKRC